MAPCLKHFSAAIVYPSNSVQLSGKKRKGVDRAKPPFMLHFAKASSIDQATHKLQSHHSRKYYRNYKNKNKSKS